MWRTLVFVVLILSTLFGCAKQTPLPELSPDARKRAIIFVPGYKGTSLVDVKSGETVWLTIKEALFDGHSLRLPTPQSALGDSLELRAGEVLHSIRVIPWLFNYPVYKSWLDALDKNFGTEARIVLFPYDWRKSNAEHLPRLSRLVAQLRDEGVNDVSIIGHSMGGLLVAAFLRFGAGDPRSAAENWEGAKSVQRAVIAGAPFGGTIIMFHDMLRGTPTGFNSSLLDQSTLASFASAYELLPLKRSTTLLAPNGANLTEHIFRVSSWHTLGWGIFNDAKSLPPEVLQARRDFMEQSLHYGEQFLRRINERNSGHKKTPTRLLNVTSNSVLTVERGVLNGKTGQVAFGDAEAKGVFTSPQPFALSRPGDGLLSQESTALPQAYRDTLHTEEVSLPAVHSEILNEKAIQHAIFEFLRKG